MAEPQFSAHHPRDSRRLVPPLPIGAAVRGTVRPDDVPVARITFVDPLGEELELDLTPQVALELAGDLIDFVRQTGL